MIPMMPQPSEKPTILIVDDHDTNRAVLNDLFQPLGFQVHEAVNGEDALRVAAECAPDIVLMDIIMPVMDGLEATRRLRQMPEMEQAVILAISASISGERQQECLTAGCQAFLSKPFRIKELFDALNHYAGIEWIYGETAVETDEIVPWLRGGEAELIAPPPQELERLHQLAKGGMVTRLRKELDRLADEYPASGDFLGKIRDMLTEFQIEEMQRFIRTYIEEEEYGGGLASHSDY